MTTWKKKHQQNRKPNRAKETNDGTEPRAITIEQGTKIEKIQKKGFFFVDWAHNLLKKLSREVDKDVSW